MTLDILLTREVCRNIVNSGMEECRYSQQNIDISAINHTHAGHLSGRILSMISDSSDDYTDDGIDNSSNQYLVASGSDTFHVFCPLTSDTIPNNTGVMFQRNMSNGHWEIFATGCY